MVPLQAMRPGTTADAVAQALVDADAACTFVPGFGASETFAAWCRLRGAAEPISFHEEVAVGVAHGAALAGTRAAVLTKAHGLVKAGNAVIDAMSAGTTAGLVLLVFEDKDGSHSDNVIEAEPFLEAARVPYAFARPSDAHAAVLRAFVESERRRLPVAVVLDAAEARAPASCAPAPLPSPPAYARDVQRHVVCPLFAGYQRAVLDARLAGASADAVPRPAVPRVPEGLPAAWQATLQAYRPAFEALLGVRGDVVAGDAGASSSYCLPPFDAIDVGSYMGSALPLGIGARLAGRRGVWAVTGDFSFLAAGHLGLLEAAARGVDLKVLVLANGVALATGGQPVPRDALGLVLGGYADRTREVPLGDAAAVASALQEAAAAPGLRIVVARLE